MEVLHEERELMDSTLGVQERVLEEMKLSKQRISEMRRTNENLDEQLSETTLER